MLKSITFREYQDSALDAGEYTIRLDQQLEVSNSKGSGNLNEALIRTLIVQGKRFALDPADLDSMYPAPGAAGDFTAVLPHLVLNLDTLPWQRSPDGEVRSGRVGEVPNYPWLALVVFNETDGIPLPKPMTLKELYDNRANLAPWIRHQDGSDLSTLDEFLEFGEKADDPVTVIDVDRASLTELLPSPADMAFLVHARGESDGTTFLPTIVANRLPKSGERHSVHLVSLMSCFNTIDASNAEQVSLVGSSTDFRLVSLHNWTFYCEDTGDFKQQLKDLDKNLFRLPTPSSVSSNANVAQYFEDGFALLPHHLRIGRDVASLYRGPLSAGPPVAPNFTLPVESADHLLLYDRQSGMLDVSYAAAWTLGRQLALEDKTFALDVYKYKRRQAIKEKRELATAEVGAFAIGKKDYAENDASLDTEMKDKIQNWLDQYQTLKNIPFQYLIPQEQLLPAESIRFMRFDPDWLKCLQYGALSLGGDLSSASAIVPNVVPNRWAFMLRSKVVTESPKLRIEGYADRKTDPENRDNPLEPTIVKPKDDMLLVYFDSAIQTVDIFLDPVNLFFGFTAEVVKDLKNTDGSNLTATVKIEAGEWRVADGSTRVININAFAAKMQTELLSATFDPESTQDSEFTQFTSADFALQMVEGSPRVRFYVATS